MRKKRRIGYFTPAMKAQGSMNRCLLALFFSCAFLAGCASSKSYEAAKQMQSVNPHAALEYVALCLQDDPDDEEARELLESIIQAIVYEHEARVASMIQAGAYEDALAECDRVIASSYLVRTLPGGPYNLYYQENQRVKLTALAAEKAYREGSRFETDGDFRGAVDAYDRALGFVENYRDAAVRRDRLLESVTTGLFIVCSDPGSDREAARILVAGIAATVMSERPRFLKLAGERDTATSICNVVIENADFSDSGWVSRNDSCQVTIPRYNKKGKEIGTMERMAYWTVYRRQISYRLSAAFSVAAKNGGEPEPSARATQTESSEIAYARWWGEKSGVPSDVLDLPSSPGIPPTRESLLGECAGKVSRELGHKLFLAYK